MKAQLTILCIFIVAALAVLAEEVMAKELVKIDVRQSEIIFNITDADTKRVRTVWCKGHASIDNHKLRLLECRGPDADLVEGYWRQNAIAQFNQEQEQ